MLPYFALSHQELGRMLKEIKKRDKLMKCLFYIWDEPAYMDDYKQIISRVDTIRKIQGPVASARLERWRDGAEELELLRLLEQYADRKAAENVLRMVYHSPSHYIEMAGNIITFRKRLISEIEEKGK